MWKIVIGILTGVDFKLVKYRHEEKVIGLTLWDTAGQERYVPAFTYEKLLEVPTKTICFVVHTYRGPKHIYLQNRCDAHQVIVTIIHIIHMSDVNSLPQITCTFSNRAISCVYCQNMQMIS